MNCLKKERFQGPTATENETFGEKTLVEEDQVQGGDVVTPNTEEKENLLDVGPQKTLPGRRSEKMEDTRGFRGLLANVTFDVVVVSLTWGF